MGYLTDSIFVELNKAIGVIDSYNGQTNKESQVDLFRATIYGECRDVANLEKYKLGIGPLREILGRLEFIVTRNFDHADDVNMQVKGIAVYSIHDEDIIKVLNSLADIAEMTVGFGRYNVTINFNELNEKEINVLKEVIDKGGLTDKLKVYAPAGLKLIYGHKQ